MQPFNPNIFTSTPDYSTSTGTQGIQGIQSHSNGESSNQTTTTTSQTTTTTTTTTTTSLVETTPQTTTSLTQTTHSAHSSGIMAEGVSLNAIKLQLMERYLDNLKGEYQCCYFLTLKTLCEFILIDQFIAAIQSQNSQHISPGIADAFAKFQQMIASKSPVNYPDFFSKNLFPQLTIQEDKKTKITSAINLVDRILKNPTLLNDQAHLYCGSLQAVDIKKGIHKIFNLQNELYLQTKAIIKGGNKSLMSCNKTLLFYKINNHSTGICDPKKEIKARENHIDDHKTSIISIHALTNTSRNSTLQMTTSLLDINEPQSLCRQSLSLLLGQFNNFTSKISKGICDFENMLAKTETGICFFFKPKQTENSKALMREIMLNRFTTHFEYLSAIKNMFILFFLMVPDKKTAENTLIFSILGEVLVFYKDKKEESLEAYIIKKFSLNASSALIPLINILQTFHEIEIPAMSKRTTEKEFEIIHRYLDASEHDVDSEDPFDLFANFDVTVNKELVPCFKRDLQFYQYREVDPLCLVQYLEEFIEDSKLRYHRSIEGENILSLFDNSKYGETSIILSPAQKRDALKGLQLCHKMQSSLNTIKLAVSLLNKPFLAYLEQIVPFTKDEEIDLGALWIQSLEREEQEHRPQQSNLLPKLTTFSAEVAEETESDHLDSLEPSHKPIPQIDPRPLHVKRLSDELLSTSFATFKEITEHSTADYAQKIFSHDLAYHLELLSISLDALQRAASSKISLVPLVSLCLNSYYHALEQAITPRFAADHRASITHGIQRSFSAIYGANEAWNDLDKMTIWYRYPNFSLFFNRNYSVKTPAALQLTLAEKTDTKAILASLAHLFKEPLEALIMETATHLPHENNSILHYKQQILEKIKGLCSLDDSSDMTLLPEEKDFKQAQSLNNLKLILPELSKRLQPLLDQKGGHSTAAASYHDLFLHIDRFANSLHLLSALKEQKFLHLHTHAILMAGQYIAEHCFVLLSIANGTEMRSHDFNSYKGLLNLEDHYTSGTLQFIKDYLSLKKGCDYPFWTLHKKNITAHKGMNLLSRSFDLAQAGEGFIPSGMKHNALITHRSELKHLIEGITAFLKETVTVAEAFMPSS